MVTGSNHGTSMANKVGTLTGIEPASPAIWADVLTTTLHHPSDGSTEIALSHSTMDSHSGGGGWVLR